MFCVLGAKLDETLKVNAHYVYEPNCLLDSWEQMTSLNLSPRASFEDRARALAHYDAGKSPRNFDEIKKEADHVLTRYPIPDRLSALSTEKQLLVGMGTAAAFTVVCGIIYAIFFHRNEVKAWKKEQRTKVLQSATEKE